MSHHDLISLFLQIGTMLTIALICGQIMRQLGQPAVVGELIGGILLGPTVLGTLSPASYDWLFPSEGLAALGLDAIIKLGMLFFLFVAGLEVNLTDLRHKGASVAMTSLFGILVPFSLGFVAVLLLPELWGGYARQQPWLFALFIGAALSISALPVIARILMDLNLIQAPLGIIVMTAATLNDLLGWALFTVVLSEIVPGSAERSLGATIGLIFGFSAIILGSGHYLGHVFLRESRRFLVWPGSFIGLVTVLILAAAALAEAIGIHAIFGAFLVGVALRQRLDHENRAVQEAIYQFAISFFAPLYFVSIGLKVNFIDNFDLKLVGLVLIIACIGKIVGAGLGARLGGQPRRQAWAIGFAMNARGAMEMILAAVALEYGLIDQRIFVALVIMAMVTSMISGPVLQHLLGKTARVGPAAEAAYVPE